MIIRKSNPKWPDAKWAVIYATGPQFIRLLTEDGDDAEVKGDDIARLFESKLSDRNRWYVATACHPRHVARILDKPERWEVHTYKRSYTRMVANDYNGPTFPQNVYFMPTLKRESPEAIVSGMNTYADWARRWAGTIGRPGYVGRHTLNRTLPHDLNMTVDEQPLDAMYGGRKEAFKRGEHKDIQHVDMVAAYPWALSRVTIPARIMPIAPGKLDLNKDGIVRATVTIPEDCWPYPLPHRLEGDRRLVWGYGGNLTGNWTTIDMRTLLRAGGHINKIHKAWAHCGKRSGLFDDWLQGATISARNIEPDLGRKLAKRATNLVWSVFGMKGEVAVHRLEGFKLKPTRTAFKATPMAPSICSMVSAYVRDHVYDYLGSSALFVDTDGMITRMIGLPKMDSPGDFRNKWKSRKIEIWGPQAYRYHDGKEWQYKVAGMDPDDAKVLHAKGVPVGNLIPEFADWATMGVKPGDVNMIRAEYRLKKALPTAEAIHG